MKQLNFAVLMAVGLLAGCAGTGGSPAEEAVDYAGTVQLVRLAGQRAEIVLDGRRYLGEWHECRCFTPECRGAFWNIASVQRKHVRRGAAELAAPGVAALNCEWVRHRDVIVGRCEADDGRTFRLSVR